MSDISLQRYRYLARFMHTTGLSAVQDWEGDVSAFDRDPINLGKYLPADKYPTLLNLGGSWREAKIFERRGYDSTTVSMSPHAKELLDKDNLKIVLNDMCDLDDIENESTDAVISVQALEHVFYPWKAMMETYRVTKNGGRIIINVPVWFKEEEDKEFPTHMVGTLQHCSVLQPYQMKFLVRQTGFRVVYHLIKPHEQTIVADKLSYEEIANFPHQGGVTEDLYYHERLANFLRGYCEHPDQIIGEEAPDYAVEHYR